MKKKWLSLLLLALSISSLVISPVRALADTQIDTIVPAKSEAVYSSQGNYVPSILSDQYTYKVSVYNVEDTQYSQPIAEDVGMRYAFAMPGTYGLKYTLTNLETNEVSYAYSVFTLIDTDAPTLFINGSYQDSYEVGTSVAILDVAIYDNADSNLTEYSYKVLCNGVDVTNDVTEGKLTINKGSYEIIYTAEDESGNIGSLSAYFTSGNNEVVDNSSSDASSCASTISMMPLIGMSLAAFVAVKMKGGKKNEKDE